MRKKIPEPNWDAVKKLMDDMDKHLKGNIVEVVRRKDCRWWERDYQPRYHPDERPCNRVGMGTPPEWFCADGERREDER